MSYDNLLSPDASAQISDFFGLLRTIHTDDPAQLANALHAVIPPFIAGLRAGADVLALTESLYKTTLHTADRSKYDAPLLSALLDVASVAPPNDPDRTEAVTQLVRNSATKQETYGVNLWALYAAKYAVKGSKLEALAFTKALGSNSTATLRSKAAYTIGDFAQNPKLAETLLTLGDCLAKDDATITDALDCFSVVAVRRDLPQDKRKRAAQGILDLETRISSPSTLFNAFVNAACSQEPDSPFNYAARDAFGRAVSLAAAHPEHPEQYKRCLCLLKCPHSSTMPAYQMAAATLVSAIRKHAPNSHCQLWVKTLDQLSAFPRALELLNQDALDDFDQEPLAQKRIAYYGVLIKVNEHSSFPTETAQGRIDALLNDNPAVTVFSKTQKAMLARQRRDLLRASYLPELPNPRAQGAKIIAFPPKA